MASTRARAEVTAPRRQRRIAGEHAGGRTQPACEQRYVEAKLARPLVDELLARRQ
jgi:hypothetical protein